MWRGSSWELLESQRREIRNDLYALKCEPTGFSQCVFQADAKCAFENVKTPLTNVSVVQGETEALVEMPTSGWILKTEETSDTSGVGRSVLRSTERSRTSTGESSITRGFRASVFCV